MIDWHGQNIRGDQIQIASGDIGLFLNAEGAIFHGNTVFKSHHFLVGASFQNAAFLGKVDFLDCTFGSGTSFEGARFEGGVNFFNSRFNTDVSFVDSKFIRGKDIISGLPGVRFSSGEFLGVCSFKRAVFDFVRSEHQNANPNVIFEQIKFVKGVDFCQTDFKKSRVSFYEARFGISSNFECAGFGDGMEFFSSIVENFRDIIGSLNGERVFIGNAGNIFYNMESLGGT